MFYSPAHITKLKAQVPVYLAFQELGFDHIRKPGVYRCPFHEDRAPSLSVREQYYNCFSSACGARGDIFNLVRRVTKCSFPEAVQWVEMLC